jgi:hypothetical protein
MNFSPTARLLREDYGNIVASIEKFKAHMKVHPDETEVTIKPKDYLLLMEFKKGALELFAKHSRVKL